eukprot:UN34036
MTEQIIEKEREIVKSAVKENSVSNVEIEFLLKYRTIDKFDQKQFEIDFSKEHGHKMLNHFKLSKIPEKYYSLLNLPCISTRYEHFAAWFKRSDQKNKSVKEIFFLYAKSLGRIISHRALAITDKVKNNIIKLNSIHPTGRLKTDEKTVNSV